MSLNKCLFNVPFIHLYLGRSTFRTELIQPVKRLIWSARRSVNQKHLLFTLFTYSSADSLSLVMTPLASTFRAVFTCVQSRESQSKFLRIVSWTSVFLFQNFLASSSRQVTLHSLLGSNLWRCHCSCFEVGRLCPGRTCRWTTNREEGPRLFGRAYHRSQRLQIN